MTDAASGRTIFARLVPVGAVVLALVVGEMLVRLIVPNSLVLNSMYLSDRHLGYVLKPELDMYIENVSATPSFHVRSNSFGLRMDEDVDLSPQRRRVIALGDSFTFGLFVEREDSFFDIVKRRVESSAADIQLLNAGLGGYSTGHVFKLLRRFEEPLAPVAAIYFLYSNDLFDNVHEVRAYQVTRYSVAGDGAVSLEDVEVYGPGKRFLFEWTPYRFLTERSRLFRLMRGAGGRILDLPRGPAGVGEWDPHRAELVGAVTRAHLMRLAEYCRSRSLPLLVVWVPSEVELFARSGDVEASRDRQLFRAFRRELAAMPQLREAAIEFHDPTDSFAAAVNAHGGREQAFDVTSHYTPAAHALFADAIAAEVEGFLARHVSGAPSG